MNYQKINAFDIANGEGIRVSLFVSGCKFHCKGCFNPQAWDLYSGYLYTEKEEELILNRLKHPDFKGLSILGGDPLWQDDDGLKQLISLCKKVHELGKDIWVWTGFTFEEIVLHENSLLFELVENCDYLIDGRFISDEKDLSIPWRGSTNQRIIDINKTKEQLNSIINKEKDIKIWLNEPFIIEKE